MQFQQVFSALRTQKIFQLRIKQQETEVVKENNQKLAHECYTFLDKFLEGKMWAAGDTVTIADLSLISTVTTIEILVPLEKKYPNIERWIKRCQKLNYYSINERGLEDFRNLTKMSPSYNFLH